MEHSRAPYNPNAASASTFSHHASDSETPLWPYGSDRGPSFEGSSHQHWYETGRTDYAPDPRLLSPRPRPRPCPPSFDPATLYDPPAATSSLSREPEGEWSNAANTAPTDAPVPHFEHTPPAPGVHTHTSASPPSFHPFASSPISGNLNAVAESGLAQPHFNPYS
jgi:hypothetical protein